MIVRNCKKASLLDGVFLSFGARPYASFHSGRASRGQVHLLILPASFNCLSKSFVSTFLYFSLTYCYGDSKCFVYSVWEDESSLPDALTNPDVKLAISILSAFSLYSLASHVWLPADWCFRLMSCLYLQRRGEILPFSVSGFVA
jgi:hypothetical protein